MWLLWLVLVVCLVALAAAALSVIGARQWTDAMQTLTCRLEAARIDATVLHLTPARYDAREILGLPAPVQRYFRAVLKDGQPIIAAATVELSGTFNLSPAGEQWKPFTSKQRIVTRRPGFLWDAQVAMLPWLPGFPVRVVDSYIAGQGLLRAAVLGLFTVADVRGDGEIACGELMRFFAEAAWYPTALLPSQGLQWEAVNESSANATFLDGPLTVTLLFSFNSTGLIDSVFAKARGATLGKDIVMLPWEGRWSDYHAHDGMMVPMTGEAAWIPSQGRKVYFVGTVTSLTHEFAS